MLNAAGEVIELETMSDVVALLRTKEGRERGVEETIFHRNGMASIEAVAVGLRARGYEVEGFETGGGQAAPSRLHPRRSRPAPRRRPDAALSSSATSEEPLRGRRSMTGRQLYEKLCDLQLRRSDWHILSYADKDGWDALAAFLREQDQVRA